MNRDYLTERIQVVAVAQPKEKGPSKAGLLVGIIQDKPGYDFQLISISSLVFV